MERYYREQLAQLRELAAEFAAAHPALAPMLASASTDPDVERLLEGVAFQAGLLRQKLDDDFPELIHDLAKLVCPQFLRPVPATTIVAFSPKTSLSAAETIPAGTTLASVPVQGTRCQFRTCTAVELHPLQITDASFEQPAGKGPAIVVFFALTASSLSEWSPKRLRLFLADDFAAATELYLLLNRYLQRIIVAPEQGGSAAVLPAASLRPAGFAAEEGVIPYPPHLFPGYRMLQEYFTLPQRFLFLELTGWERWLQRGNGSCFSVRFELSGLQAAAPRVTRESFLLFAAPAINLFSHDAVPILMDHRRERYLLRADSPAPEQVQIFSVDRVTGLCSGERRHDYLPFEQSGKVSDRPAYHTLTTRSQLGDGFSIHLSVVYPRGKSLPEPETLSVALTCCNGSLAELLRLGDLCIPTDTSPESATFRNVTAVTPMVMPFLEKELLWRLVSHLSLNKLSLATAENLRLLLSLYLGDSNNQSPAAAANRMRVAAIQKVTMTPFDWLIRGLPVRGTEVTLRVEENGFAGAGDLYLFASVLNEFLSSYASINSVTRLAVEGVGTREKIQWQPRLGERTLL